MTSSPAPVPVSPLVPSASIPAPASVHDVAPAPDTAPTAAPAPDVAPDATPGPYATPALAPESPLPAEADVMPEDAPSHAPVSDTEHAPDTTTAEPEPHKEESSGGIMSKFKEMLK